MSMATNSYSDIATCSHAKVNNYSFLCRQSNYGLFSIVRTPCADAALDLVPARYRQNASRSMAGPITRENRSTDIFKFDYKSS